MGWRKTGGRPRELISEIRKLAVAFNPPPSYQTHTHTHTHAALPSPRLHTQRTACSVNFSAGIFWHLLQYDTIRHAMWTCARKPTWVSLIYRTEPTTLKAVLKSWLLQLRETEANFVYIIFAVSLVKIVINGMPFQIFRYLRHFASSFASP